MPLWVNPAPPAPQSLPWQQGTPPPLILPAALPNGTPLHPTSGLLGKRNLQPRSFVTGNTTCTYRVRYPVTITASRLRMTFPAWSTVTAGVGDEPTGNTVTLAEVYAEYGGVLYPVTFLGQTSYTMDSGGAVTSDEVAGLVVAAGTTLYIRTYVTVPSGGRWPGLYGAFTFPDEVSRPGVNLANATGDLTGTGQATGNLYGPLRVFGEIALGQPFYAVTICGDSIAAGTNDSFSTEANAGYYQRAFWPGTRPFSIVALPGENGTQLLAQGANRADIVGEYADYVINQYGINDLQSGATLAQLQARSFANTVISRNPWVNSRLQQTLGPKTSSTDGWVTVGNQTTDTINTARVQFNDWVRDGMPEIGQNAVATDTADAVRAGQGGHPYTGYIEVADLCESARNSGLWKANYTSDGLHPNVTGNAAIAAALDLSVFVDTFPTGSGPAPSLARLATSPAMLSSAFQGASNSQAFTSNTFSPPAGSVVIVSAQATQSFNNAWNTPTITDSLGSHLTWTLVTQQADVTFSGAVSTAALFWAVSPSAQTNMTVTVTQSCTAGQTVTFSSIAVDMFTGANTTAPIGTNTKGALTANALPVAITPAGASSALLMFAGNAAAASGASSAGTGEYLVNETHVGTSFAEVWYGNAVGPTIPATAQTLDITGATARWQYIAYEVKAADITDTVAPPSGGTRALGGTATDSTGTATSQAALPAGSDALGGPVTDSGAATVTTVAAGTDGGAGTAAPTGATSVSVSAGSGLAGTGAVSLSAAAAVTAGPTMAAGRAGTVPGQSGTATTATGPSAADAGAGAVTAAGATTLGTAPTGALGGAGSAATAATTLQAAIPAAALGVGAPAGVVTGTATTTATPAGALAGAGTSATSGAASVASSSTGVLGSGPGSVTATATTLQGGTPARAAAGSGTVALSGTTAITAAASGAESGQQSTATTGAASLALSASPVLGSGPASASATAVTLQGTIPAGALALGRLAALTAAASLASLASGTTTVQGPVATTSGAASTAALAGRTGATGGPVPLVVPIVFVITFPRGAYAGAGTQDATQALVTRGAMAAVARSITDMRATARDPASMSSADRSAPTMNGN